MFTDQDVRNGSKVCLLGQTLVRELFQGNRPWARKSGSTTSPSGWLASSAAKGANMMGMDQDDILLAPWTTIKYRVTGSSAGQCQPERRPVDLRFERPPDGQHPQPDLPQAQNKLYPEPSASQQANTPQPVRFTNVDQILVAAAPPRIFPPPSSRSPSFCGSGTGLARGEPDDFSIRDMTEMTKALSSTANMMTKLLLAVALISLVVGGVGIMNIMLVSVTERTREIGLRMAVGAWSRDILQQFLVEAVILCFCGGTVGILLGRGISTLVRVVLSGRRNCP